MNANELAEIMMVFDSSQVWEHAEEIAGMLRQQQSEISKLKEMNSNFVYLIQLLREEVNELREKLNANQI